MTVEGERGVLTVPENRRVTDSNRIDVGFLRFPTDAADPGPPVVFLSGGPGDIPPALADENVRLMLQLTDALRASADFIMIAQRGDADSDPELACPMETLGLPLDAAMTLESEIAAQTERANSCLDFWRDQRVDVIAYNAREMAADVDALREALGYDTIALWGGSFGSHHAIAVLKEYGGHVERAVLSQVEGPDHTFKRPADYDDVFMKLADLIAADPELSGQVPDFTGLIASVAAELEAAPVTVEVPDPQTGGTASVTFGAYDLQRATIAGVNSTQFLAALPALYVAMSQGDFSVLAQEVLAFRTDTTAGVLNIVPDCMSGASDKRRGVIEAEASESLFGAATRAELAFCDALGLDDLGEDFRAELVSDLPVLLISGALDARTPAGNGEEVLSALSNGRHLVIENVSHDLTFLTGSEAAAQFLLGTPDPDAPASPQFAFEPIPAQ